METNQTQQNAQIESLICKSQALNDEFDNLGLFRSKNQVDREPLEPLYEATIEKGKVDIVLINNSESYKIHVKNLSINKEWDIHRTYDEFAWLYTSLKVAFPGYILPYFSSANVIENLSKKLFYLKLRQKQIYLTSRHQELREFLDCILKSAIYGYSDEIEIFLTQDRDQYLKAKRNLETYVQQISNIQNASQKVVSLLERGINYLSGSTEDTFHHSKYYLSIKFHINAYSEQLYSLTQKMFMYKHSKQDQITWKGSSTEIDAVELLTAKIASGKPAAAQLISQLQSKILLPLITECKKQQQLRRLLTSKQNIQKSIQYLKANSGSEEKLSKLLTRDEKFKCNLNQQWIYYKENWLVLVENLESQFRQIIDEYSRQMYLIWK